MILLGFFKMDKLMINKELFIMYMLINVNMIYI